MKRRALISQRGLSAAAARFCGMPVKQNFSLAGWLALCALLTLNLLSTAFAQTNGLTNQFVSYGKLYVSQTGNDTNAVRNRFDLPFRTITAATAAAESGDTVIIGPGSFAETLNIVSNVDYSLSDRTVICPMTNSAVWVSRPISQMAANPNYVENTNGFHRVIGGTLMAANGYYAISCLTNANLIVEADTIYGNVQVAGNSSLNLKVRQRMRGNFYANTKGAGNGTLNMNRYDLDIPYMTGQIVLDGPSHLYFKGQMGMFDTAYVGAIAVFLMNGAHAYGVGDIFAQSDAIDARTNSTVEWHGTLRSTSDSGLFVDTGSTALIYGDIESTTFNGYWQLCGSGTGVLCGCGGGQVVVYGNVRGYMAVVNDTGWVAIHGNVYGGYKYIPYVMPVYREYLTEPGYATAQYQPGDILNRGLTAVSLLGSGTNIIYGNIHSPSNHAVHVSGAGLVELHGSAVYGNGAGYGDGNTIRMDNGRLRLFSCLIESGAGDTNSVGTTNTGIPVLYLGSHAVLPMGSGIVVTN